MITKIWTIGVHTRLPSAFLEYEDGDLLRILMVLEHGRPCIVKLLRAAFQSSQIQQSLLRHPPPTGTALGEIFKANAYAANANQSSMSSMPALSQMRWLSTNHIPSAKVNVQFVLRCDTWTSTMHGGHRMGQRSLTPSA